MTDKAGSGEQQAKGATGAGGLHRIGTIAPAASIDPIHVAEAHDSIARNLRQAYQSTVDEPVPDSIADLLSQLR